MYFLFSASEEGKHLFQNLRAGQELGCKVLIESKVMLTLSFLDSGLLQPCRKRQLTPANIFSVHRNEYSSVLSQ